jgi:hypothetical protein
MSKNYEWYVKADLSEFAGKWVAIVDQKPVVSGTDAEKVYIEAKERFPGKKPSLVKIPTPDTLVL